MTQTDRTATLTERQHAAALALVRTGSYAAAARAGQCSERTLRRWRNLPAFRDVVAETSRAAADDARHVLTGLQMQAARTLRRAMRDENAHVRVRAARAVLETAARAWAEHEISERLDRLERQEVRQPWPAA